MFVYLYVDSSVIKNVLWILTKIRDNTSKTWLPISIKDPVEDSKVDFALLQNKLGFTRKSKAGYSFFIKLLNLNDPDLKIEVANAEIVSLSATSISHSVKKLDDVLTSCLQDRLQVALSDVGIKLDLPDESLELQEQTKFDVILSAVDLSDEDFKRSAVSNKLLDLNFVGSVDFKDYRELDALIEKASALAEEESVRLRKRMCFTEFEKRLAEGNVQLVWESQ